MEELSLDESWKEQSSEGGKGTGEGQASGSGRLSLPSQFSMSSGKIF